jgi:hypothetical protein
MGHICGARCFSFYGVKHNLIPHSQFGAVPPAIPGITTDEAAQAHQEHLLHLRDDPNTIIVYTDSSQLREAGGTMAGTGWVLY